MSSVFDALKTAAFPESMFIDYAYFGLDVLTLIFLIVAVCTTDTAEKVCTWFALVFFSIRLVLSGINYLKDGMVSSVAPPGSLAKEALSFL